MEMNVSIPVHLLNTAFKIKSSFTFNTKWEGNSGAIFHARDNVLIILALERYLTYKVIEI
jgi:hypothetical protein